MPDFTLQKNALRLIVLAFAWAMAVAAPRADAAEVTVFAAASSKTALDEIAAQFRQTTGHKVTLSYAGSSVLARQIHLGAPANLFISANPGWMDFLQKAGLLAPDSRTDLLGNTLVLVAHGQAGAPVDLIPDVDLMARLEGGRLAMALVDAVPAGIYGKAALENLGIWHETAAMVAQTDNARAALALVALGEAPLGIVYATDAVAEENVTIVADFTPGTHPPIIYPAAIIATYDTPVARLFLAFLQEHTAAEIFTSQGFALIGE